MISFKNLIAAALLTAASAANAAPAGQCFSDSIRVSALVNLGKTVKVGIIDIAKSNSYFVAAGESAGPVDVIAIDYAKEQVTLRKGGVTCVLNLAGDPNAQKAAAAAAAALRPESPDYRGEAIEKFLREHPEAVDEGAIKFPLFADDTLSVGHGPGIDAFLSQHPDIARDMEKPAVGKGEGIEAFLREHPEIKIDDTPLPEDSLGPGIEEAMKKNALVVTNNFKQILPPPAAP